MSATWRRAPIACVCGGCGAAIAADTLVGAVAVPGLRRRLLRCPACRTPDDPAPALVAAPLPFARFTAAGLPFDWKARACGDREPGMEG